jgi:hypothetical protein
VTTEFVNREREIVSPKPAVAIPPPAALKEFTVNKSPLVCRLELRPRFASHHGLNGRGIARLSEPESEHHEISYADSPYSPRRLDFGSQAPRASPQ